MLDLQVRDKANFEQKELRMSESDFQQLVERARGIEMTPSEKEQQRRSFAFGNANIENASVTRAMIDSAAEELSRESRRHEKPDRR